MTALPQVASPGWCGGCRRPATLTLSWSSTCPQRGCPSPEADAGPILVTVEFTVTPEREAAFLQAMDRPDRFIGIFSVRPGRNTYANAKAEDRMMW